jgi:hypothetical protein
VPDYIPGKSCDTSFKYYIENDRGKRTAEKGMSNFNKCVAHVLIFNRKFESIKVIDRRTEKDQ